MDKGRTACGVALGIVAGLVLIGVFIWQLPKDSVQWAAWIQAFGVIFSVIAAWKIGNRQAKTALIHAEKMRRRYQAELIVSCMAMVDSAQSNWGDIPGQYDADFTDWRDYVGASTAWKPLIADLDAMKSTPIHEIFPYDVAVAFLTLRSKLTELVNGLNLLMADGGRGGGDAYEVAKAFLGIKEALTEQAKEFDEQAMRIPEVASIWAGEMASATS
ncbi:hypothetical protein [Eoetvoesiella caeni]